MTPDYTLWIKDALIVNQGREYIGSIGIADHRIVALCEGVGVAVPPHVDRLIEAQGLLCLPGVIDDQVHFRDPGLTHKGSIESESRAALLGGVTSYMDMPNTSPQTITREAWDDKMRTASETSWANYAFYMGTTNDNTAVLQQLDLRHTPGVKVFMGASTGNMLVDNEATLRRIFSESPLLVAIHSESEEIIQANKERFVAHYGEADVPIACHPEIRSSEACLATTEQAIALARETGARLHILHLSTGCELPLLESSATPLAEKQITAEVCVHHLWFESADYDRLGARIKWNPAIKSAADRAALRQAVRERRIDIIATDHAPHLLSEKEGGALRATSGAPLVEHSLLVALELSRQGEWSRADVVDMMCHRPAALFGVQERGTIVEGYYADLVLVDPNVEWTVTDESVHYKCGWTPLVGTTLHHRVHTTILNGAVVVEGGECTGIRAAMPLVFDHRHR